MLSYWKLLATDIQVAGGIDKGKGLAVFHSHRRIAGNERCKDIPLFDLPGEKQVPQTKTTNPGGAVVAIDMG